MKSSDPDCAALEARLRRLEDHLEIQQLVAAYGPLVDCGDSRGAAALWSEGGRYEVGGFATAEGRAGIVALFDAAPHQEMIARGAAHVLSAPWIEIDGDRAVATGHSVVFRRSDEGFAVFRIAANRWELRRGTDGWRVGHRINRLLDGDEAARALFAAGTRSMVVRQPSDEAGGSGVQS